MTPEQINRLNGDRERPEVIELKCRLFDLCCALADLRDDNKRLYNLPGFSLPGGTMVAAVEYQLDASIYNLGAAVQFLGGCAIPAHATEQVSIQKGQADA